jgi:TM2 domain-containing membrane protein YozV
MIPHENQSFSNRDYAKGKPLSFLVQKLHQIMLNRSTFASLLLAFNLTALPGFASAAPAAGPEPGSREIIPFD